jgi:hypothetical protein
MRDWLRDGVTRSMAERRGTFWPGLKTIHSLLDEMTIGEAPRRPRGKAPAAGVGQVLRVLVAITAGLLPWRRR